MAHFLVGTRIGQSQCILPAQGSGGSPSSNPVCDFDARHLTTLQLKLRLKTLLDKKRVMQARSSHASKTSTTFVTLQEGFQQFGNDLNKLQVRIFCEVY